MSKIERSIFRKEAVFWLCILGVNLFFYNNCSEQQFRFRPTEQSLRSALNTGAIIIEGANVEFTKTMDVRLLLFSGQDNEMYVTNDPKCASGGQWEPYSDIKNWSLSRANQEVSVYVKYKDADGVISDCLSDSIIHDGVPPTLVYEQTPKSVTNVSTAPFSIKAYDNLSKVDKLLCAEHKDGPFTECAATFSKTTTASGSYSQYAQAVDKAGNTSDVFPYHWTYDDIKPTLQIVQQPSKVTAQTDATFQIVGQDNLTSISAYLCGVGSGALAACPSGLFNLSNLPEGTHIGKFQVVDGAGNASDLVTYEWTIDRSKPSVQITEGPGPFTNVKNPQVKFVGTSPVRPIAEYRCAVNGGAYSLCASPYQFPNLTDGQYTFSVIAVDDEGLQSAPASRIWTVDTVAPNIQIVEHPNRYTNSKNATFRFVVTDADMGPKEQTCTVDGANVLCPVNVAEAKELAEGDHRFVIVVKDRAGNSSTASYDWTVDLTPPTITITNGPDALTNLTSGDIAFSGSDNIGMNPSGYKCRINPTLAYSACTSPASFGSLTEGKHIVDVIGTDLAGNESAAAKYEWTVDVTGPVIVFTKQPSNHDDSQPAYISFNVSDEPSKVRTPVQCILNGVMSACGAIENRVLTSLAQGPQNFTVIADDNLGNRSTAFVEWTVFKSLEKKVQIIPVQYTDKVDILFVVDNSGSMSNIQDKLSQRINGFITQLAGLNWQIALTTTDPNANTRFGRDNVPWGDGQLRPFEDGANSLVLKPSHANPQSLLGKAITVGASGDATERGINANYRFLQRATGTQNPNYRSFIRNDAALTTILISDEDECSKGCGQSVTSSQPENLIQLVKDLFGANKVFVFNAIISVPGQSGCKTYAGNTYQRLQELTQGLLGSVCSSDYAAHLSDLGSKVASLVRSVQLECPPVDTTGDGLPDVKVTLEAGQTPPSYSVQDKLVTFVSPLPTGQHKFEYSCKK